ncbi:MAG: hypothetical protein JWO19_1434 [Bryobacterales bacterium]|nr:hypothetical protein [Bryobacterales bacterium]
MSRRPYFLLFVSLALFWSDAPRLQAQPTPFTSLQPGYTQEVFGAATIPNIMGGVAFAPDGDVWTKGCGSTAGALRFDLARSVTVNGTSIHPLQAGLSVTTAVGCGLTNHPDGRLYLNTSSGAQRIDADTGAVLGIIGPPGNLYGITVDPQTSRLVYAPATCTGTTTCTLVSVDPSSGNTQNLATFTAAASLEYVDGVTFDPTGNFILVAGRTGVYPTDTPYLYLLNRNGTLVRQLPADRFPDGVAFHTTPFYFVTNNNDGSVSRFDFPGDDLRQVPVQTVVASGGFRGDLTAVGTDGCYYVTQAGTRYSTGVTTGENSVVRICSTTGNFTPPPGVGPLVANAFGDIPLIAPNTWVSLKGSNLSPAGDTRIWKDPDFVNNQLPTRLDGVGVTVNGKNAYVYYISPTQVNILTPPDALTGPVQVQLTNGTTSYISTVQAQPQSLSFFEFVSSAGRRYVYGRHLADNTIIGPTTLFTGLTTPVKPGETIYVAGNGFGPTDAPVVSGAFTQSGTLPKPWPVVQIGGVPATVLFAGLVSPGTYIFNLVLPASLPDGDLALTATYNGLSIQPNLFITVQH